MKKINIQYIIKDKNGFLVEVTKTFASNNAAKAFIRNLQTTGDIVGMPVFIVG